MNRWTDRRSDIQACGLVIGVNIYYSRLNEGTHAISRTSCWTILEQLNSSRRQMERDKSNIFVDFIFLSDFQIGRTVGRLISSQGGFQNFNINNCKCIFGYHLSFSAQIVPFIYHWRDMAGWLLGERGRGHKRKMGQIKGSCVYITFIVESQCKALQKWNTWQELRPIEDVYKEGKALSNPLPGLRDWL